MKKCPFCAEEIQEAAIICRYCCRDLASVSPVVSQLKQTAHHTGGVSLRMPSRTAIAVGIVLLLAGFVVLALLLPPRPTGRQSTTAPSTPAPITSGSASSRRNPTSAQLARIIVSSDEACPRAERIFFQGIDASGEMWNVRCSTGQSYVVSLKNTGENAGAPLRCAESRLEG